MAYSLPNSGLPLNNAANMPPMRIPYPPHHGYPTQAPPNVGWLPQHPPQMYGQHPGSQQGLPVYRYPPVTAHPFGVHGHYQMHPYDGHPSYNNAAPAGSQVPFDRTQALEGHGPAPAAAAPVAQRSVSNRTRPNAELRPGVFAFQVKVVREGKDTEEFEADTGMSWEDFYQKVVVVFENPKVLELKYKIPGEGGGSLALDGEDSFQVAIKKVVQKAMNARTCPAALEVRNGAKAPVSKPKSKRSRKEDIPPEVDENDNSEGSAQLRAFRALEKETKCELHDGYCYMERVKDGNTHRPLDHRLKTLWAKQISVGKATIYKPPHTQEFEQQPLKSGKRIVGSGIPEIHVTVQNIHPEPVDQGVSQRTPPLYTEDSILAPSLSKSSLAVSRTPTPPPPNQLILNPTSRSESSAPKWSMMAKDVSARDSFPSLYAVMQLLEEEYPSYSWDELEACLRDAGITHSHHILLADQEVLSCIAFMGDDMAGMLRDYAKQVVLPALGLPADYTPSLSSTSLKRPHDETEGFSKKPRLEEPKLSVYERFPLRCIDNSSDIELPSVEVLINEEYNGEVYVDEDEVDELEDEFDGEEVD